MKKIKLLIAITFIVTAAVIMQSSAPPPPGMSFDIDPRVETLDQTPPALKRVFVRKLPSTQGGYTMLLQLELDSSYCYEDMSDSVNIFWGDMTGQKVTFYDNGIHGDNIVGDGIYSAYVTENVSNFRAQMIANEGALMTNGGYYKFTGHSGERITTIPHFDATGFDMGSLVEINPDLIMHAAMSCNSIIREKSLFITDTQVVEDPARTYDFVHNTGNPTGVWTFGELFRNIAGPNSPRALLKSWVENWTRDFTMNDQLVEKRGDVIELLLAPWISKASGGTILPADVTLENWESKWYDVEESKLLQYAPFKLTAIVNRIDLRGNTAYSGPVSNAGETRFIFTLLKYDGSVPAALDPNLPSSTVSSSLFNGFLDWEGMNVIFEYGNVQSTRCDLRSLAEKWVALGGLEFANPSFNDQLQVITDYVTARDAAPSRINGTALNRIRTNERIFYEPEKKGDISFEQFRWGHADWEFRQFELSAATHLLKQVPLTNTPIHFANHPANLSDANYFVKRGEQYTGSVQSRIFDMYYPYGTAGVYNQWTKPQTLADWALNPFVSKALERGNHNMATTFHGEPLLAANAIVVGEFSHYWDVENLPSTGPGGMLSNTYPEMRHQLSLNTCEGCHNGETKTIFTHVRPLALKEQARYWGPPLFPPDNNRGYIDCPGNGLNQDAVNTNTVLYPSLGDRRYYQNVSAFLTGTLYSGLLGAPTYDDDHNSDADDDNMEGLFYVYDPSTATGAGTIKARGFNDLMRRRDDLCLLYNSDCNLFSIPVIVDAVAHVPLPLGGH